MKTKTPRSPRRIAAGLCGFIALEPVQYSHTHDRNRHPELVEGTCGCYRYRGLEENRHHELVEATCGCYRYHGLEENCHPERSAQRESKDLRLPSPSPLLVLLPKKIKLKSVAYFSTPKNTLSSQPRLPRIPPQLHHKNTTPKTRIFPKHPSKTPANRQQRPTPPRQFFSYKI
jgi:hypothetical protein